MTKPNRYHFEVNGTALAGHVFTPARGQPRACAVLTGPLTSVKEQTPRHWQNAAFWRSRSIIARSAKAAASRANLKTPFAKVEDIKGRRVRPRPCNAAGGI